MRRTQGFILVVALAIMAVLMMLGFGASMMSNNNLQIAGATTKQALARYRAEAGLEAAYARLGADYLKWPCWLSGGSYVPAPNDIPFVVTIERLDGGTLPTCVNAGGSQSGIPIVIRSTGYYRSGDARTASSTNADAEYTSTLIVRPNLSNDPDPIFAEGLVTAGSVDIPSNAMLRTNIWTNGNVTGGGSPFFKYIQPPSPTATADQIAAMENGGQKYLGRSGTATCGVFDPVASTTTDAASSTRTQCLTNQPPPYIPRTTFEAKRAELMTNAGVTQSASGVYSGCTLQPTGTTVTLPAGTLTASVLSNSTRKSICLAPGQTLNVPSGVQLKNVYIIGDASTTVNVTGGTGPIASGEENNRHGMSVASGSIGLSTCNGSSCPHPNDGLTGINTFVARSNMDYQKAASSPDSISRTLVIVTGDDANASNFPGDVTISGVSGQPVNASFWVRGRATLNGGGGTLQFTGTIVSSSLTSTGSANTSQNAINFNGAAAFVRRPPGVENPLFDKEAASNQVIIISRQ